MYRLLVADDEHIVVESIRFIAEKNFDNVVVIAEAGTGKEAIEQVEIFKPDIVFMDIRMPGIDGIEAIKEIKKRHPDTLVIILTAYDYFTYAQEALTLNVLDFLIKPIDKSKVVESIQKAIHILARKMADVQNELAMKEKLRRLADYLEHEFVYSALLENDQYKRLEFYQEILNMDLHYGYVMLLNLDESVSGSLSGEPMRQSLKKQEIQDLFRMSLKSRANCLVGAVTLNRGIAFIPVVQGMDEYAVRNRSIEIANEVKEALDTKLNMGCAIGIGRAYNVENLLKSYEEADKAIKLAQAAGGGGVSHISDIILPSEIQDYYPLNKQKILIDRIVGGDTEEAKELFEELFNWMSFMDKDMRKIKNRFFEISLDILRALSAQGLETGQIEHQRWIMETLESRDLTLLKMNFWRHILEITLELKSQREERRNELIENVKHHLAANFSKDIKLNDVAKEANMSYHYFSKFFKDETGHNFTDYLVNIRIKEAKKLLDEDACSIKEVSVQVGYKDPNYFSKIFKKMVGLTPTEFRERTRNA
ncbi:MAG: response regulator [Desulfitobacteriaceae bacterium]|nr:response regulator [Desulfitobacteriaceae bacterium]